MSDYLIGATAFENTLRIYAANTKGIVASAKKMHNLSVTATAALGRALTAASIMGSMEKNENDLINIRINGDGPLKGLIVISNKSGNVKGYVGNSYAEVPLKPNGKIDVSGGIGRGTLSVLRDINLKQPYVGEVELETGEIAEDLSVYFLKSQQTNSAVMLGVAVDKETNVTAAGGIIMQVMPECDEEVLIKLETKIKDLGQLTTLLENGHTIESILNNLIGEENLTIHEKKNIKYYCDCSLDKVVNMLSVLDEKELRSMIEEDGGANIHCSFCNTDYDFNKEELTEILLNRENL